MPSVEEIKQLLAEAEAKEDAARAQQEQRVISNSVPSPQSSDRYAVTTWGETEYDFRTPSGQLCRLRKLDVTALAETGLLDKITRLPGIAMVEIAKAEGQPPKAEEVLPDRETIAAIVEVLNVIIPMAVIVPQIWPLPEKGKERVDGRIYVDSIEVTDRVAIMERSLGGIAKFDNFRKQS